MVAKKKSDKAVAKPKQPPQAWFNRPVERRKLTELRVYPNNPRTHTEEQVDQIAASMREFGFTQPLLVDEDNMIIAGHGRLMAAPRAGLTDVPVIVLRGLSEPQKRALVIADNKIALNAGWDEELLHSELKALADVDYDLSLTGFADVELTQFLTGFGGGEGDPEDAPPIQERAISKRGDLWTMGKHRLLCGSAEKPEDVAVLFGSARAVLMITDPPYGVNYGDIANARSRPANVRKGGDGK